jgi:hypothetical protein
MGRLLGAKTARTERCEAVRRKHLN